MGIDNAWKAKIFTKEYTKLRPSGRGAVKTSDLSHVTKKSAQPHRLLTVMGTVSVT